MPSPKQQLIEHLYDGDLAADVVLMVADRDSWRTIAEKVSARSGVEVSYEALRLWYGALTKAAS